jgi:hypothetical protein
VRAIRTLGSAEGALGDRRFYSNITIPDRRVHDEAIWVFSFAGIRICVFRPIVISPIGPS